MKLILSLFQQALLLVILVGGGFFAYFNQNPIKLNIPYINSFELPLWLICFISAFIGFVICYIIMKSILVSKIKILPVKKQSENESLEN